MNTSEKHAVVLGGSLAGLLAARVLADHFENVTLIERDVYTENCETRRGIPQANHVQTHPLSQVVLTVSNAKQRNP